MTYGHPSRIGEQLHHEVLHHLELLEGKGSKATSPSSPIWKIFSLLFGLCKSQDAANVKAQHDRHARKKDTKSAKEIHSHLNL
jgi:hypothetical protein